jgi:hypothetical protein
MNEAVLADLCLSAEELSNDALWPRLLAENLYWASCEGFLQSSVLGAFNGRSTQYVADRERELGFAGNQLRPDLVLIRRADHEAYWTGRDLSGAQRRETLAALAQAIVQFKLIWTQGNATGSAQVTEKAKQVALDASRAAAWSVARESCTTVVGILVSGFHKAGTAAKPFADATLALASSLAQVGWRWANDGALLLDEYADPRWTRFNRPSTAVSARLLWAVPA